MNELTHMMTGLCAITPLGLVFVALLFLIALMAGWVKVNRR